MRRCTRFLPSTAKWTALLCCAIAACSAASPTAIAQSPNRVINLLCKGDYFAPADQGRIAIGLDSRQIGIYKEGTTRENGWTTVMIQSTR